MKLQSVQHFKHIFFSICVLMAICSVSCRGQRSSKPPVMPVQNMVEQTSFGPQSPNDFFPDKRAVRTPVAHTVAEGEAYVDIRYDQGQEPGSTAENPKWTQKFPLKLDMDILKSGQKNFDIYCAPCHGLSGHNNGLVTQRSGGTIRPAEIHGEALINMPVGQIYHAVTEGVNNWNMPGFKAQLNTAERWAVVSYVRALQLSEQNKKQGTSQNQVSQEKGEQK